VTERLCVLKLRLNFCSARDYIWMNHVRSKSQ
jgi:hypothetical protein